MGLKMCVQMPFSESRQKKYLKEKKLQIRAVNDRMTWYKLHKLLLNKNT